MKLTKYIRENNGTLAPLKEADMNKIKVNHAYEGDFFGTIDVLLSGNSLLLIKKKDINQFRNEKNDIAFYALKLNENYDHAYSLAHCIPSHANGLAIDELENILMNYHPKDYSIISLVDYGQFFEYSHFIPKEDYIETFTEINGVKTIHLSFLNADMKKRFHYVLSSAISISDTLSQIDSLKVSEDVLFVHHEKGVGYAARNMKKLEEISGYKYENYLIKE
jgi:hypothetical protein